jgi:hypothetical protein
MKQLHKNATPMIAADEQVGWRFEHPYFVYDAIEQEDGKVRVYIQWTGMPDPDDEIFNDWDEVIEDLTKLIDDEPI